MSTILGRFSEYLSIGEKEEGEEKDSEALSEREEAIKAYMGQGGIIKIDRSGRKPRLVYPGDDRINKQIENLKYKEEYLRKELSNLRRKQRELISRAVGSVKKVLNPIYWQHKIQKRRDENYLAAYEEIDPPMEKLDDPRYKSMLEMFVKEPEYRERLLEASRSELGRGRDTLKERAIRRDEFTNGVVENRIKKLEDKLKEYKKKKRDLKVLLKWSRE